jgi:hypothetical protein
MHAHMGLNVALPPCMIESLKFLRIVVNIYMALAKIIPLAFSCVSLKASLMLNQPPHKL